MGNEQMLVQIAALIEQSEARTAKRFDSLEARMDKLEEKVDRNHNETVKTVADVVEVIGKRIQESETMILSKIQDVETVTAQNAFDVQLMKHRA